MPRTRVVAACKGFFELVYINPTELFGVNLTCLDFFFLELDYLCQLITIFPALFGNSSGVHLDLNLVRVLLSGQNLVVGNLFCPLRCLALSITVTKESLQSLCKEVASHFLYTLAFKWMRLRVIGIDHWRLTVVVGLALVLGLNTTLQGMVPKIQLRLFNFVFLRRRCHFVVFQHGSSGLETCRRFSPCQK